MNIYYFSSYKIRRQISVVMRQLAKPSRKKCKTRIFWSSLFREHQDSKYKLIQNGRRGIHMQPLIWVVRKLLPRSKTDILKVDFSVCLMFLTFAGCYQKQNAEPEELLIKSSIPGIFFYAPFQNSIHQNEIYWFRNTQFKENFTITPLPLKKNPTSILGAKMFYYTN